MVLMPKSSGKGFTLVELLVTVSIISILSAVGLVVFTSVMKQGRDSKRQSDLRSIQSALEQYYADQMYYPQTSILDPLLNSGGAFTNGAGKTYMNSLPKDPTGTDRYHYEGLPASCTTNCSSYCLYANFDGTSPGKPAACTSYSTYDFALTPP